MVQQFKWNIFCIVFPFLLEHNDNGIPLVAPLDLEDKKNKHKISKGVAVFEWMHYFKPSAVETEPLHTKNLTFI